MKCEDEMMGFVLGQSKVVPISNFLLCAKALEGVCCSLHVNYSLQTFEPIVHMCHQSLGLCEVSDIYLLGCWSKGCK